MALSNHLTQAEASPDLEETTLYGLILESLDSIAGPLAIFAAGLTWCLVFDLTVPPPEPARAALASASAAPATAEALARESGKAMPKPTAEAASMIGAGLSVAVARRPTAAPADSSLASAASLYAVSHPAPSPHSLRTDRPYATAGLALTRTALIRP